MRAVSMRRLVPVVGTVLLLLSLSVPAAGQAEVRQIDVHLTFEITSPHPVVQERLQGTVHSVADRLLFGRAVDQLLPVQARLAETLSSVVERVATGYTVTTIAVEVGVTSSVMVSLSPVGTVVREVEVSTDLHTINQKLHALFTDLLRRGVTEEVRALFSGVPVLALEWAGPVIEARARAVVEQALVGYTAILRERPGASTLVELAVTPRDARLIRNISVRFRSTSIPTTLLEQHVPQVASMAEPLRGLSVAFAEAHRHELERVLMEELAAYPPVGQYHVVATVGLDVAETTYVTVLADSLLYRGRVEAQLNIGVGAPGPAIVVHLGRLIAERTEAFVETRIVPNTLGVAWDVGGEFELAPTTVVGLSYTVVTASISAFTRFHVGRDTSLRGTWNLSNQSFEGGLTYRANEFLAGELVATSKGEVWLRLISNL